MTDYNPQKIESRWQKVWAKNNLNQAVDFSKKPKFYCLDMFPYPSGEGLHVGHWRGYVLSDIWTRYQILKGKNILHPMGFDAFGLPAENAAIKKNSHPAEFTETAISKFKEQLAQIGSLYDWEREINTSSPDYYRWTQWLFLQLYKQGLAYRKKALVNFCPSCHTVLANEQVVASECERCGSKVVKKDLKQWFFKITKYADRLLADLGKIDWPARTKILQKNWIGRSEGVTIKFEIRNSKFETNPKSQILNSKHFIEVFTTRPDTLFGATYLVLAPEHEMVAKITTPKQKKTVAEYVEKAGKYSEIARTSTTREKTGVFTGAYAVNPVNGEKIPVWVADYVLRDYATGAIMCVPAHDQRDFEFAKKYDLPIKDVIIPHRIDSKNPPKDGKEIAKRNSVHAIVFNPKTKKYLCLNWKKQPWIAFVVGGAKDGEDLVGAAKREIKEETGFVNVKFTRFLGGLVFSEYYAAHKNVNRQAMTNALYFELIDDERVPVSAEEKEKHEIEWLSREQITPARMTCAELDLWFDRIDHENLAYEETGILINSGEFDGLDSNEAKIKITSSLAKKGEAKKTTTYHLRDWLVSRQRYWGAPIPIIYCNKCGEMAVPENELPVVLPKEIEFKPTGGSPLKHDKEFLETKCPKCGGEAVRETDTLDTFVCSSWYYLRYADAKNSEKAFDEEKTEFWLPVDLYIGGIEHATMHLLYARFICKFLHDFKLTNFDPDGEPFRKLFNIGMIYYQGAKMSKSKGNIVSPDELVAKYGTDALRGYEMFIGPADEDSEWMDSGILGIFRFLKKVWGTKFGQNETPLLHHAIKKVTEDLENFRLNTAISAMMEYFNHEKKPGEKILILMAPIFPHLAEELWQKLGHKNPIFEEQWPEFNEKLVKLKDILVVVQINGKVRDKLTVVNGISEKEIIELAKKSKNILALLADKKIKKTIWVPNRLINFVI
ncbi:MAG TPA: class I tRNA ligase family protein [Patescibacteria group bacterium]|nr:class I tRNA ligase family protein [Patescibacteria group bacterium]